MKKRISLLPFLFLLGCSVTPRPATVMRQPWVKVSDRKLADWAPEKALEEANSDIANGSIKMYARGTVVAVAVGVEIPDQHLIMKLPWVNLSTLNVAQDKALLEAQDLYANIYNKKIITFLRSK